METFYEINTLTLKTKEQVFTDNADMLKMSALEVELCSLSSLFKAAAFVVAEQDFKRLFQLKNDHLLLKREMEGYFQRFIIYPIEAKLKLKAQSEVYAVLEIKLGDIINRFKEFKNKLFAGNRHARGCL